MFKGIAKAEFTLQASSFPSYFIVAQGQRAVEGSGGIEGGGGSYEYVKPL